MNIENELKLISANGTISQKDKERIIAALQETGIKIGEPTTVQQEDTYFDTRNNMLEKEGRSFRIRKTENKVKVTYKAPRASTTSHTEREEYEITVPPKYVENIDMKKAVWLLRQKYPAVDFNINIENMEEVLTVINNREKYEINSQDGTKIEMCFDSLAGKDKDGINYKISSEIEFELIEGNKEILENVYKTICDRCQNLQVNKSSKYKRAKEEIKSQHLTEGEVATAVWLSTILGSNEFSKLQYKGQIRHRYDKPLETNLDNFKDIDYLVKTLSEIKRGQYKPKIPKGIADKEDIKNLLRGVEYQEEDNLTLEEMVGLLLSDVSYRVADEVLVDFLNKNYYANEKAMTNRLSHSQQVMLIVALIAKSSEVKANFEEKITALMSGLSHDIGHVPFSHTLERHLRVIDGFFSHDLNGKKVIEDIYSRNEETMCATFEQFFPALGREKIKQRLTEKTAQIKAAIMNHSRKGSEQRDVGINNQGARVADKLCYVISDICDLMRTKEGINILDKNWIDSAIISIFGGNEDLATQESEKLKCKFINPLIEGDFGRALVNATNTIRAIEIDENIYYDVDNEIWKFIERLIRRNERKREEVGIDKGREKYIELMDQFINYRLYILYKLKNDNIEEAWEHLLKEITNMDEIDILEWTKEKFGLKLLQDRTTERMIAVIAERVYQMEKKRGSSDSGAKKEAEQTAERLKTMPYDKVKEFFGKYDILGDVPKDFPEKILGLSNRVDVQLKIDHSNLFAIWEALGINSTGELRKIEIQDRYYNVKSQGQDNISLRVRTYNENKADRSQDITTVIVKKTIEKKASERTTKKYEIEYPMGATIQDVIQKINEEYHLGLELMGDMPSTIINIERHECVREFDTTPVEFKYDIYRDEKTGKTKVEVEIQCPTDPTIVSGKIKKQLRSKGFTFVPTSKKDSLRTDKGLDENPGISPEQ